MGQADTLSIFLPLNTVDCTVWRAAPQTTHHQQPEQQNRSPLAGPNLRLHIGSLFFFYSILNWMHRLGCRPCSRETAESKLRPQPKRLPTGDDQRAKIKSLWKPGDVSLTYSHMHLRSAAVADGATCTTLNEYKCLHRHVYPVFTSTASLWNGRLLHGGGGSQMSRLMKSLFIPGKQLAQLDRERQRGRRRCA